MSNLEASQGVLCVYTISGQYCYAPRVLYYVLTLATVVIRKHIWLAAGAAAYVMTYAAAAAFHAIILCAIHASSTPLIRDGHITVGSDSSVSIQGRVLDLDTDATLAVVGVGFLMLLPMAVFSTTFQKSEAKPILAVWGLLMLVGLVCCLTTLYGVNTTSAGPFNQYQICIANGTADLSISNLYVTPKEDWNTTISDYFKERSTRPMPDCFYPCLYSSQIMRSQSDITTIPFPGVQPGSRTYWSFAILTAFAYACVPLYVAGGLVLLLHKFLTRESFLRQTSWTSLKSQMTALVDSPKTVKVILRFVFVCFEAYAIAFAPVVILVFIAFAEYAMSLDPESESIRHVGQWQPLLSVGLVLIAALLSRYKDQLNRYFPWLERKEESTESGH